MKALINSVSLPIWISFFLSSLIWIAFPQIDVYISGLFYVEGEGFPYSKNFIEGILYESVRYVLIVLNVSALLLWLYNRFSGKNILDFNGRKLLFVLLVLAIGSGLIVNALLKDHWGRARPAQTIIFGGDLEFTPAFILSDQGGYSFSSGHGSAAFALMAYAMLFKRRQKVWMALAVGYGVAVSIARIVAGGHFFSDTVVSFFIILMTAKMLYYLIFEREASSA
ncbi:MAG: phosphatase PAP2 family protein [Campylobacterota bacterium]|nr:phosphatase PAP2 family protein [Campylobacterota bacterium]